MGDEKSVTVRFSAELEQPFNKLVKDLKDNFSNSRVSIMDASATFLDCNIGCYRLKEEAVYNFNSVNIGLKYFFDDYFI